jgi:CheY-like chemotaxis protein
LPRLAGEPEPAQPITVDATAFRARDIVLIEDNLDFREGLRSLLQSWGHRVEEASSGAQGLDMIQRRRQEIVLIELGLPGLDGYAVARALRAAPGGEELLLVAITGYGRASDRHRAQEAGFDAHLTKPVSLPALAALLVSKR